ncbi:MAG: cysteine desulfurase, partial [Clostridiales bacterium]|nr:cysteine desulfurase [Clostridiales bacterium]
IIFTSGGTEADNLALIGTAMANNRSGRHLITTCVEHPAILETMKYLTEQDFEVTYLPVDNRGVISLVDLENAIRKDTILVSIMHTNNEVGALQPVELAGELIKKINPATLFHVDAVQGFGKSKILPKKMGIDMLSVSGHKIHGPKGIGFLYCNEKVKIKPITFGGGQQKGLRSGTQNVPGIAGLGMAVDLLSRHGEEDIDRLYLLRERFVKGLEALEGITINGPKDREGAPHIISASVSGIRSEVLLHSLESKGIYVSSGSACASNKPAVSATLKAMGVPKDLLDSTLRFSFSVFTTEAEIDYTLQQICDMIPMLRKFTRH